SPDRRSARTMTSCRTPSGCSKTSRRSGCRSAGQQGPDAVRNSFYGSLPGLLRTLRAVLGARLLAFIHSRGVERAADDMVADARQVLPAAAVPDELIDSRQIPSQ